MAHDRNDPYLNWRPELPDPPIKPGTAALMVIDMQYSDASMDAGVFAQKRELGLDAGLEYFERQLNKIVPNIRKLQELCRQANIEVVFSRIQSMSADGRDRGGAHKDLNIACAPGSRDAQILDELAPLPNELVFSKTTGSSFNGTNLDFVLRNMGIRTLIMTGVMTSGCVESAVRDAKDLGYGVLVVDDACASWTEDLHRASLRVIDGVFGKVTTMDRIVREISRNISPADSSEDAKVAS